MTLREQLDVVLPHLLPAQAKDAIKAKELIALIREELGEQYSDPTYRSHFSFMVMDENSCLAKVESGQGYYLRKDASQSAHDESLHPLFSNGTTSNSSEEDNLALKALALVVRSFALTGAGVFVYPPELIEVDWERPDLVVTQWPCGDTLDGCLCFDAKVKETDVQYISICLGLDGFDYKADFFRTLATGMWAQQSELVLIAPNIEEIERAELQQLAAKFGVGIRCWELAAEDMDEFPPAADIFRSSDEEVLAWLEGIVVHDLALSKNQSPMAPLSEGSAQALQPVYSWVHGCLQRRCVQSYERSVSAF